MARKPKPEEVFNMIVDNKFDITGTEMKPSEFLQYVNTTPKFLEVVKRNEQAVASMMVFRLYSKALTGDFNSMKYIFDKVLKPEEQMEVQTKFIVEMPVINKDGEITDEYDEIEI
jgi:hypothetical protein